MSTLGKSRVLRALLEDYEWELPTSFIDVVFLLLLYYTLTMKFHTLEQRLEAWLPKDKGPNQIQQPIQTNLDEVVLTVTAVPPTLKVPIFRIRTWETNDVGQLIAQLKQLASAGKDRPVVINGKPDCPFKHIMSALDACAFANLTKIEFRAPPAGPEAGGSDSDRSRL